MKRKEGEMLRRDVPCGIIVRIVPSSIIELNQRGAFVQKGEKRL